MVTESPGVVCCYPTDSATTAALTLKDSKRLKAQSLVLLISNPPLQGLLIPARLCFWIVQSR